jgi:hypothetical protein
MEDNRWPKIIMKWLPEGRGRRGENRSEVGNKVQGVMREGDL